MGLRERLTRLEETVLRPKLIADTRAELRAAAEEVLSSKALYILDDSPPPEPPPWPKRNPDLDVVTWPHPWPKVWWHPTYLREGTAFPPGTRLVVGNAKGESDVIDAAKVERYREAGWKVTGVDEITERTLTGKFVSVRY